MRRSHASVILGALLATACVQTSDLYAVRQWANPRQREGDDRPRVNYGELEAKRSFADFVRSECGAGLAAKVDNDMADKWVDKHPKAAACVGRIAAYAVDQCVMITRRQNVVAADANLALGGITMASGLAALSYAISGNSADRVAAASLAGAAGANNNGRAFLPTNVPVPVINLFSTAPIYAEAIGLTSDEVGAAAAYNPKAAHKALQERWLRSSISPATRTISGEAGTDADPRLRGDGEIVKLGRIHDAVLSNCAANAYGLRPAHKPSR